MSTFSTILNNTLSAAGSVLSLVLPSVGTGLLTTLVNKNVSDPVSSSGAAVATGTNQVVTQNLINAANSTATLLNQQKAYNTYLSQGYTSDQALQMSGLAGAAPTTSSNWLKYALYAVGAYLLLKIFKIIR